VVITGGFNPRGEYDNLETYVKGDSVSYLGSSYVCYVATSTGNLPTDTSYWQLVASIGPTGDVSKQPVVLKSEDYTLTGSDAVVIFTASKTATLPASTGSGQTYRIVSQVGTVTIVPTGSDTIKGESSQVLYIGEDLIVSDVDSGLWE
jgi:hypothetical protein